MYIIIVQNSRGGDEKSVYVSKGNIKTKLFKFESFTFEIKEVISRSHLYILIGRSTDESLIDANSSIKLHVRKRWLKTALTLRTTMVEIKQWTEQNRVLSFYLDLVDFKLNQHVV